MGTPVIGSTVKLTGKVLSQHHLGHLYIQFTGADYSNLVHRSAVVNAEIVVEPLKVGDENLKHTNYPHDCRFRIMAIYEDKAIVRQFIVNNPVPMGKDWVCELKDLHRG